MEYKVLVLGVQKACTNRTKKEGKNCTNITKNDKKN